MYPPDSVEQLQKAGIEFQKHEEYGILPNDFAELMITSGLVLAPETKWISFHRWVLFVCCSSFLLLLWLDRLPNSFRPCVRAYVMAYVMCLPMIKFLFFLFSFSITADHSSFSHIQKTFLTDHKPYKTTLNPLPPTSTTPCFIVATILDILSSCLLLNHCQLRRMGFLPF